jgi:hypothetical protein
MPTPNTSARSTGQTRKPRAPALPKIIQTYGMMDQISIAHSWAAHTLNKDTELQAIERLSQKIYEEATYYALYSAQHHIRDDLKKAAEACQRNGGLLYAFHGSKAFAMPAQAAA